MSEESKLKGRLLYAYGMCWLPFWRMTPTRWIFRYCDGHRGLRALIGGLVLTQFGWVRNPWWPGT